MLTIELKNDEIEHLLSLNDSELATFFEPLKQEDRDRVILMMAECVENSTDDGSALSYADSQVQKVSKIQNAKTAASQEIGPLPEVADPERRARCAASNILSAETYFPATFYIAWAPYQRSMMNRFEDVVFSGGRECHSVRRGGLKSTCARVSTLWAVLNGHRRFSVLVGATDDKSSEHRENLFALMASSETLLKDYPELIPLLAKWRRPKRQFRLGGRLLTLHPKDARGRIVFPDIHEAPSCEAHVAPYSVNATDVAGLSFVDRFGVSVRPDLLVFDDVQTPQSAGSPTMTAELEESITKTFCGLVGLGEKLAAIMVGTVRKHNDLTERFLSRKVHADWDGKRYPSIIRFPEKMFLWEVYGGLLGEGASPSDGKALAQAFYLKNRTDMDAGGVVAWEEDKLSDEVSALQSLMTVRALDPEFFRCEIQQEGLAPVNTAGVKLNSGALTVRISNEDRGFIPEGSTYTVGFIDSSDQILWGMVCTFQEDFTGSIVDYRTWPDQERPSFYKSDLVKRISDTMPGVAWEEAFVNAHNQFEEELFEAFPEMDLLLKDWSDGGQMMLIRSQIAASTNRARMRPAKGFMVKPGRKPIHLWGDRFRDRSGNGWIERRTDRPNHVQFDANIIKSVAARRLLTTVGAPSSVLLPGKNEYENRLLVEHFTSENPVEVSYDGSKGVQWVAIPGRDNDFWDCYCGCVTAASVCGARLTVDVDMRRKTRTFAFPER